MELKLSYLALESDCLLLKNIDLGLHVHALINNK